MDDDSERLRHRWAQLAPLGYSVASYTFKKLNMLASAGALFLQHLKNEARILRDIGGQLRYTLDAFQPKQSYAYELAENAALAHLVSIRPNTSLGALWAADVLYVATRNFGVLYLGQSHEYVFSYIEILRALANRGIIMPSAIFDLLQLRWAKSVYRSGGVLPLDVARQIVDNALAVRPDPSFPAASRELSPEEVISRSYGLPSPIPAYHRLRNIERAYVALHHVGPARPSVVHGLHFIKSWIENPRVYTGIAGKLENDVLAEIQCAGESGANRWMTAKHREWDSREPRMGRGICASIREL